MPKFKVKKTKESTRVVPYAPGFHSPAERQRVRAIGDAPLPKSLDPRGHTHFTDIPQPKSQDDWLAKERESGQSFFQFMGSCPWLNGGKRKYHKSTFHSKGKSLPERYPSGVIYLLPLGEFDSTKGNSPELKVIADYASLFYHLPVKILSSVELDFKNGQVSAVMTNFQKHWTDPEKIILDSRFDSKSGHYQLKVNTSLVELSRFMPEDGLFTVAVTMQDLYADNSDLFVAGIGSINYNFGIFSFFRYNPALKFSPEFWYEVTRSQKREISKEKQETLLLQRSCKLLVHEMGHLFGINHCIYYSCCMNGSGHLAEDFEQPMHLCPVDLHKVQRLCGFDIEERYRELNAFFSKHDMAKEADWVQQRLIFIQEDSR